MRFFSLFIILAFSQFFYSQNFVIEYVETFSDGDNKILNNTFLVGNNEEAYYFNYKPEKNLTIEEAFNTYSTNKSSIKIKYDKGGKIFEYRFFPEKFLIGFEDLPKMTWVIGNKTKMIMSYLCNNASTSFRGRKYEAWFTKEIPINIGPWKFNNLPGLILEIRGSENNFSYVINKIILQKKNIKVPYGLRNFFNENSSNYIPYNELYNRETNFLLDLRSKRRASAPVGTKFIDSDIRIFLKEKEL